MQVCGSPYVIKYHSIFAATQSAPTRPRSDRGDEVNEAARIEACATGGRILASKALIDRLDDADAIAVGLDRDHTTYTQLADLATATHKARRDAPAIAVCELWPDHSENGRLPYLIDGSSRCITPAMQRDRLCFRPGLPSVLGPVSWVTSGGGRSAS
jgi:hypothetical protein